MCLIAVYPITWKLFFVKFPGKFLHLFRCHHVGNSFNSFVVTFILIRLEITDITKTMNNKNVRQKNIFWTHCTDFEAMRVLMKIFLISKNIDVHKYEIVASFWISQGNKNIYYFVSYTYFCNCVCLNKSPGYVNSRTCSYVWNWTRVCRFL